MRAVRTHALLAAMLSVPLAGCGSSTPSSPPPPPPPAAPTITGVQVTGFSAALKPGETLQLAATATLSNGTSETVTSQASWRSENTNVAMVSAAGLVTAITAGTTEVRASYQNVSGGVMVEIVQPPATFSLCGTVTETPGNLPLDRAYVEIRDRLNAGRNAETNNAGRYCIMNLRPDGFTAQAGKSGYDPLNKPFALTNADGILDFALTKTAAPPPPSPPPPPPPPPAPLAPTVSIGTNGVSPSTVIVSVGQRVTFVNNSSTTVQIASDPHPSHFVCPEINFVGAIGPGQARTTDPFPRSMDCSYHDHFTVNPIFNGRILVR